MALRFFAICKPCVPIHNAPNVGLLLSKSSNKIALTSCFCAISFCARNEVLSKLIMPAIFSAISVLFSLSITLSAAVITEDVSLK